MKITTIKPAPATDMTRQTYWMVHSPTQGSSNTMHHTQDEATAEAQRLAGRNVGNQYMVLQTIDGYSVPAPVPHQITITQEQKS